MILYQDTTGILDHTDRLGTNILGFSLASNIKNSNKLDLVSADALSVIAGKQQLDKACPNSNHQILWLVPGTNSQRERERERERSDIRKARNRKRTLDFSWGKIWGITIFELNLTIAKKKLAKLFSGSGLGTPRIQSTSWQESFWSSTINLFWRGASMKMNETKKTWHEVTDVCFDELTATKIFANGPSLKIY